VVLLVRARPTPKDENNGAGAPRTEVGDARLPGFCLAGHATRYDLQVLLVRGLVRTSMSTYIVCVCVSLRVGVTYLSETALRQVAYSSHFGD
jgi:hypothetical protein